MKQTSGVYIYIDGVRFEKTKICEWCRARITVKTGRNHKRNCPISSGIILEQTV